MVSAGLQTSEARQPQAAASGRQEVCEQTFVSEVKPVWCPGCGGFSILASVRKALATLQAKPERVVVTGGIGCSSRMPAYLGVYGYHTVHGRALPVAIGAYLAQPELTHLVIGGDGDMFSIGGGHLPHAARRNPNITVIILDNEIYGLTKGQPSPTTPLGIRSKSIPNRLAEQPLNPALMCLAYDVSFFARGFIGQPKQLTDLVTEAIRHPGFAVVHVLSPCVTFNNMLETWRQITPPIPDGHDVSDRMAAMRLASDEEHLHLGVYYKVERPTMIDVVRAGREEVAGQVEPDLEKIFRKYA